MLSGITESIVEEAAISWFSELGYARLCGPDIAPSELLSDVRATEMQSWEEALGLSLRASTPLALRP